MSSPAPSPPDVGVIVVAAGQGTRLGGEPKQFRPIAGVPMLLRALRPFLAHPDVGPVVAVLPPEVVEAPPDWLAQLAGERLGLAAGGATRSESVRAGLAVLPPSCRMVLVHDGARPFVTGGTIGAVVAACRRGGSAIAAIPVRDTLKREGQADPGGWPAVEGTVERERLWRAQTPQGFPRTVLERAHASGAHGPDDASLVEQLGEPVALIVDTAANFKITTADDLALAEVVARGVV